MPPQLRPRIIASLILALIVFLALTFYADAPRLWDALLHFDWRFLGLALAATCLNYFLRFIRWHYYLDVIGIKHVLPFNSLLIFLTGFSLTMTPGKLGELLKSFLLKERYQIPVSYSAAIVVAERLTDVFGMLILAALGLALYPAGVGVLTMVLLATVLFVIVVQQRTVAEQLLDVFAHVPLVGRLAEMLRNLYESTYLMLRLKPLLLAIGLAVVAWFGECVSFWFILQGVGAMPSGLLLLQATFIYAAASLFGAASMLPGGLGATEASMAVLVQQIIGIARQASVAATLIVRWCTLWFAVLLGVLALVLVGVPRQQS